MKKTDKIFHKKLKEVKRFAFNKDIADVFDDMAERSIPCYLDLQEIISRFALNYYQKGTNIFDLGCSTGNTILKIFENKNDFNLKKEEIEIIAVDKSAEMLNIARKKCRGNNITWVCDPVETIKFKNASVIIASYVLQFIEPIKRMDLLQNMYNNLTNDGILILAEKVIADVNELENISKELYHDFKRKNNYSDLEIEQKEEALKNVLLPVTLNQYRQMLNDAGFAYVDIIFKYLSFSCLIAVK